jgi:hypothetical protein
MKKQTNQLISLMILLIGILVACNPSGINDPISFDQNLINQQILLRAPSFGNTFTTKDSVLLELKYNSVYEITFPKDFNIRIFQKTKKGWTEIYEIPTTRISPDEIVFSPQTNTMFVQPIYFHANLPDLQQKYLIRVYVFGQMKTQEENKEVAAYIDVSLHP